MVGFRYTRGMSRAPPVLLLALLCLTTASPAAPAPPGAKLFLDFDDTDQPPVRLFHGAKRVTGKFGTALQFTDAMQYAELDAAHLLDGVTSATVGGWFLPKRARTSAFPPRPPG